MKKYSFIVSNILFFILCLPSFLFAQSLKGMKVPIKPPVCEDVYIGVVWDELDNVLKPEFNNFINSSQFKEAWLSSGMTDEDLTILKKYLKKYDIGFRSLYGIPYDSKEDAEKKQRFENYNLVLHSPLGKLNIESFFPKTLLVIDKYADTSRYKIYHLETDNFGLDLKRKLDPYEKSLFIEGFPAFFADLIPELPIYAKECE